MTLAVVILNWNGKSLLAQFLPSIIAHSPHAGIYVVDNASTDDSIAFLQEHYPQLTIIRHSTNKGYAGGYNDALQQIDADIYCLLNSDVEVTPGWLRPVLACFQTQDSVAVVQPKILDYKQKTHFEYAGAAGGYMDKFGYPFCRGRIFDTLEKDDGQYNDTALISWASGACFFVRRAVFHQLSGFDEDYFAHQEEIDLCWRVRNLGFEICYTGESTVYHVGGATLSDTHPRKTFLNFRNSLFSLVKNVPRGRLFFIIFIRLILDAFAGIRFLFMRKPRHLFAIVNAHFSFFTQIGKMVKKRGHINSEKKYYHTHSIVWLYFIRGKKYFYNLTIEVIS